MDYEKAKESWSRFMETGKIDKSVQHYVALSWEKCRNRGIDPFGTVGKKVEGAVLASILKQNQTLLESAVPVMNSVCEIMEKTNYTMALTDGAGYILYTIGAIIPPDPERTEVRMQVGCLWNDLEVGSNAIGIALDYDTAIQMNGPEHYLQVQHGACCSAAPIHDICGDVVGCLNIVSLTKEAHPHSLGLVKAAAFGIEMQLASGSNFSMIQNALDSISDSVLILNKQLKLIWINNIGKKLIYAGADLAGQPEISTIIPDFDWKKLLKWKQGESHAVEGLPLCINNVISHCNITVTVASNQMGKIYIIVLKKQEQIVKDLNSISGNHASFHFDDILASDPVMLKTISMAKRYASYDGNILIEGESGTGKELFAQSIHNESRRRNGPFVAINCATLPRDLIESELFGYEKGAFTGAQKTGNPGKFELADGGTIFLDEIGEMPLEFQAKLLRVVETLSVRRIGGKSEKELNLRIIAATNRNLQKEVDAGHFRGDLYFRLNIMKLNIPPLRDRPLDIEYLANQFINRFNVRYPEMKKSVDRNFLDVLCSHSWPGNVRELQNGIERAYYVYAQNELSGEEAKAIYNVHGIEPRRHANSLVKERDDTDEVRKMESLLREYNGNVTELAGKLGTSRASMYRRIEKLGIRPKDFKTFPQLK
jgi:sigma-54 dependent transcriptional regulator, acetoin dehydrogenase operon transcriptional activator AcoR